jgi:hypothetical protein
MILTECGPDGTEWEVLIQTDVIPYPLPLAYPDRQTFDRDARLKWDSGVYAWPAGGKTGYEVLDHRSLHYEPPTDAELEAVRERRREREQQLWETIHDRETELNLE